MKRACEAADIPYIRIHDLRHSHVSLLIDLKFTPHLIAERIGDTVQMVNNTYGHLYPARHQEVADCLNKLIEKNSTNFSTKKGLPFLEVLNLCLFAITR